MKCLPDFVDVPLEVLDDFDDALFFLPDLIEEKKLDYAVIANILRLHRLILFASSRPELKDLDEDTFSTAVEWNNIREKSKEILVLMGEKVERPDLKYI